MEREDEESLYDVDENKTATTVEEAKALLAVNGPTSLSFDNIAHGISSDRHQWKSNNIKDVEIIFLGSGVLFELSKYFAGDVCKCAPFMSLCAKGFESFTDMSKCEK